MRFDAQWWEDVVGGEGGKVEWDGIGCDERNCCGEKKWEVEIRRRRCSRRRGVQWCGGGDDGVWEGLGGWSHNAIHRTISRIQLQRPVRAAQWAINFSRAARRTKVFSEVIRNTLCRRDRVAASRVMLGWNR